MVETLEEEDELMHDTGSREFECATVYSVNSKRMTSLICYY